MVKLLNIKIIINNLYNVLKYIDSPKKTWSRKKIRTIEGCQSIKYYEKFIILSILLWLHTWKMLAEVFQ